MFISIDASKVDVPEAELALVNLSEFNKAKEFIMKSLSPEDLETLKSVYQFNIHPLDIAYD